MTQQSPKISQALQEKVILRSYRILAIQAHSHLISAVFSGSLCWSGSVVLAPGGLCSLLIFSSVLPSSMKETVCSALSQASFRAAFLASLEILGTPFFTS